MDYRGQKLSENIYYFLTILFGVRWRKPKSERCTCLATTLLLHPHSVVPDCLPH